MEIKIDKQLILEGVKMNLSRAGLIGAGIGAAASAVPTLVSGLHNGFDDPSIYVPGIGLTTAASGLAMYNQNKMNQDPKIKRDLRTKVDK